MASGRAHGLGLNPGGEICTFKVYPGAPRGLYWQVRIFESRAMMHASLRANKVTVSKHTVGCCAPYRIIRFSKKGQQRTRMDMGQIFLFRGRLGAGVVSHEMTHAALHWGRRLGGLAKIVSDDQPSYQGHLTPRSPEEGFCYGLSAMINQVYDQLYRRNVV